MDLNRLMVLTNMNDEIEITKNNFWALPLFEFVEEFNQRNEEIQAVSNPSEVMHYVHLHFRPRDKIESILENILYVSIVHNSIYQISGCFSLHPNDYLNDAANKERAVRVAQNYFKSHFSITDEENTRVSRVTPRPFPHLVHRYFKFKEFNEFNASELYFNPIEIPDFSQNSLEAELKRFLNIIVEEDGR